MAAPAPNGASFDVLLQFSLDEEANRRVQNRTSTIEEELKRIQDQAKKTGKALNESMNNIDTKAGKVTTSVIKLGTELAKLGERAKAGAKGTNEAIDSNIRKFKQLEEAAKRARQQSALISGAAARASATFGQGLAVGGLVAGGILAEANRYAKEREEIGQATRATREWTKATEDLAKARARVDNVLLKESLPLLQQAARVAEQAASFIEKNPELVRATINAGVIIAGVSAIGLAVSKGIKLVADAAYIAAVATELVAARLHKRAAEENLAAAAAMKITNRADDLRRNLGLTPATGTKSLVGQTIQIVGQVTLVATSLLIGAELGNTIGNAIAKLINPDSKNMTLKETTFFGGVRAVEAIVQKIQGAEKNFLQLLSLTEEGDQNLEKIFGKAGGVIQSVDQFFQKVFLGMDKANQKADELVGRTSLSVADSPVKDQLLAAYEDYREDDLALVQEHYRDRNQIVKDALNAELEANQQYADSVARVNRNLAKSLASALADYQKADARAAQQYQQQRAQIIRDGAAEIERIERDSKERLAKLEQEHEERRADIIARRDALALSKEDRGFEQAVNEEKRQAAQEIKERRQAIAQRLADLQQSYEAERAQRAADYQARVAELRAQAAEQLKELAIQHAEEIRKIREQKVAKLKELDAAFNEERKRRYYQFLQQLKDLDAGLLAESKARKAYQTQMLADLDAFLAAYRNKLNTLGSGTTTGTTGGTVGTHDYTGYAYPGLYKMADNGQREFVLSGSDTKAAEKIIGGQLSAANLMGALQLIGGNRQMNYIDQRRIDQPVSKWDKRQMEEIAVGAMLKVMKGA